MRYVARIGLTVAILSALVGCQSSAKEPDSDRASAMVSEGKAAEEQNRPQAAEKMYQQALSADAQNRNALYQLARLQTTQKQYPEAVKTWKKYVEACHGSADAYNNLGYCEDLAGNANEAETAYKKGLSADPLNTACRVNYGLFLARHDRPNEALMQLQQVMTPAEAHYNIALAYDQLGRRAEAQTEYRMAVRLNPNFIDAQARIRATE
ncbi:MAG: tetratricopeptide repeat protein [Tepidisphaeraceae bacterium]